MVAEGYFKVKLSRNGVWQPLVVGLLVSFGGVTLGQGGAAQALAIEPILTGLE
jgi:hypothetical protein